MTDIDDFDPIYDTRSIDHALAFSIHHTARLLRYHLQRITSQMTPPITPEQWFILFRLYEEDGLTQAQLADKILNDRPNITRQVTALEKLKLIVRAANPDDGRSHRVFLTREGQQFVQILLKEAIEARQLLFKGISGEELQALSYTLHLIRDNITKAL